jgi:hypothetical protein
MISSNTDVISIPNFMFVVNIVQVISTGSNGAISTSKITAIRKNLYENASHRVFWVTSALIWVSCCWSSFFYEIKVARIIRAMIVGWYCCHCCNYYYYLSCFHRFLDWKSSILLLY